MRLIKHFLFLLSAFVVVSLLLTACNKENDSTPAGKTVDTYDRATITKWNDLFLELERYAAGYRPGPAPRALGLIGLANYEACVSGMPGYNSLESLYGGLTIPKVQNGQEYHWPTVVNATTAYLFRQFFPNAAPARFQQITTLENQFNTQFQGEVAADVFARSKEHGENVAKAVWDWSKTDVWGHDAYLDPFKDYDWQTHFFGNGAWVPTDPGPGKPMFPNWGKVRTFAISEADKLCPPPHAYSTSPVSRFYAEAAEVYARTGSNQSYEDLWIGEFWSDDLLDLTFSPGPRWTAIANQVFNNEQVNLETAIYANAKVGMALNDAAVACWHSKYYYNIERPESYIKREMDANWEPALFNPLTNQPGVTPSFPAYPSGHSTMGAAAAEALTDVFGIHYAMTDRCHENRSEFEGKPRAFNSFYEMAEENAESRIPLGVHFRMDCEQGVNLGYRCGRKVNQLPWKN